MGPSELSDWMASVQSEFSGDMSYPQQLFMPKLTQELIDRVPIFINDGDLSSGFTVMFELQATDQEEATTNSRRIAEKALANIGMTSFSVSDVRIQPALTVDKLLEAKDEERKISTTNADILQFPPQDDEPQD